VAAGPLVIAMRAAVVDFGLVSLEVGVIDIAGVLVVGGRGQSGVVGVVGVISWPFILVGTKGLRGLTQLLYLVGLSHVALYCSCVSWHVLVLVLVALWDCV
jgi:hypothetical protein